MFDIGVSEDLREICPQFRGAAILCDVKNSKYNDLLWSEIDSEIRIFKQKSTFETVKLSPVIKATREAYKKLGKDPNRYRPSSEALCRRIIRDLPLYKVSSLVDLINLISIKTGYSIGGFDADKIEGNKLVLGVGVTGEPYEAIGRGAMNIEGLPVYRDQLGGIGTPTSDHERTKLSLNSTRLLALFNGYDGGINIESVVDYTRRLLVEYVMAEDFEILYY